MGPLSRWLAHRRWDVQRKRGAYPYHPRGGRARFQYRRRRLGGYRLRGLVTGWESPICIEPFYGRRGAASR